MKEKLITAKEVINTISSLNEMASVGRFGDCKVVVNSEDHEPPHVHLLRDGDLVAKIEIPLNAVKNQKELVIIKKGKQFKEFLLSDFIKWINSMDTKIDKPFYVACKFAWDILHD